MTATTAARGPETTETAAQTTAASESKQTSPKKSYFTDGEIIKDEYSYKSKYVSAVQKSVVIGKHIYYVIDIRVKSMACFATAVASKNKKYDYVSSMAKENNAVCAINGDYFGLTRGGAAIRNGNVLSSGADNDVCVIYVDGHMEIFTPETYDEAAVIAAGAWQAWDFGPSLLDDDGKAKKNFTVRSDISGSHPRTALGYYSPGHYC